MSEVDLAVVKEHVSAVEFDADDVLLQRLIDTAEAHVTNFLRRDMAVDYPDGWPEPIRQVVCMLVAFFYDNRGGSIQEVEASDGLPEWFKELLHPYRDLS